LLYKELQKEYGRPFGQWQMWCRLPKTRLEKEEVAIGAILAQRTNWKNVEMAAENLKRKGVLSIKKIGQSGKNNITLLERLVRPSGFYRQKASRLYNFSRVISKNYGSLEKFFHQPLAICRRELLELPGIGPETADSILLYAGEKPIFVIDEYTRRLIKERRLSNDVSYDCLQKLFQDNLPKNFKVYQDFHALIVIKEKTGMPPKIRSPKNNGRRNLKLKKP